MLEATALMLFTRFVGWSTTKPQFIAIRSDQRKGETRLKHNNALLLSKHCVKLFMRMLPVNEWLMNLTQAILSQQRRNGKIVQIQNFGARQVSYKQFVHAV